MPLRGQTHSYSPQASPPSSLTQRETRRPGWTPSAAGTGPSLPEHPLLLDRQQPACPLGPPLSRPQTQTVPVPESVIPLCPAGPGRPGSPCLVASLQLRGRESPPAAQVPCRAMWPPCSQLPPQPHAPSLWRPLRPRKAAMPQPLSAIVHSTSPGGEGLSLLLLRTSCPLRVMGSPRAQPPSHWGDVVQTLC